ncbi:MAG: RES family NAD+ phosphorylase [Propionivibrio sp.]
MIDDVFAQVGLAEVHDDLLRNIVSLRVSQDLFDDLSDDANDWHSAINLELSTKPSFFASPQPIIDRPYEEALWNDAINYPFKHWQRSRYSDGSFGVWYGADTVDTTVFETAYHWRQGFLRDAGLTSPGDTGIRIERTVYRVRCDAALVDLRPVVDRVPALIAPHDYTLTQQVGARLHREGHPGLVTRSARCSGDVYPVLNPVLLSLPRQLCHLTYATTASGVTVEREPGVVWFAIPDVAS